jgi:hypothetical protein
MIMKGSEEHSQVFDRATIIHPYPLPVAALSFPFTLAELPKPHIFCTKDMPNQEIANTHPNAQKGYIKTQLVWGEVV